MHGLMKAETSMQIIDGVMAWRSTQ